MRLEGPSHANVFARASSTRASSGKANRSNSACASPFNWPPCLAWTGSGLGPRHRAARVGRSLLIVLRRPQTLQVNLGSRSDGERHRPTVRHPRRPSERTCSHRNRSGAGVDLTGAFHPGLFFAGGSLPGLSRGDRLVMSLRFSPRHDGSLPRPQMQPLDHDQCRPRFLSPQHEYEQHQQDGRKNAKAPQQSVLHGLAPRMPVWRHEGQPEFSRRSQCLKHLTMRKAPVRWFVADLPGR